MNQGSGVGARRRAVDTRVRLRPARVAVSLRWPPLGRWLPLVAVVVGAGVAGAAVRWWQIAGRDPLLWSDSGDFEATAEAPWTSLDLWAGPRSPAAPVLLKLVGGDPGAYMGVQAVLAVVCWAALVGSVFTAVAGRKVRWLAAGLVLVASVSVPVTMWERSVLSESVAASFLALVAAAGIQVARRPTGWRVAALLVALSLWVAVRDSHVIVAVAGGAAVGVVLGTGRVRAPMPTREGADDRRRPAPAAVGRRPLAVLALGALTVGPVAGWAAAHGDRHAFPMRNVYQVRVLPYPERVAWFADHGMPQSEVFAGPRAREPFVRAGESPVVHVAEDDTELGPWLDWVASEGRSTFVRYVAEHPGYLVTEPLRAPERAFNNAEGSRASTHRSTCGCCR